MHPGGLSLLRAGRDALGSDGCARVAMAPRDVSATAEARFSQLGPVVAYLTPELTSEPRESVEPSSRGSVPVPRAPDIEAKKLECSSLIKNENDVCQGK